MGIGAGLFLVAVGAIITFGVTADDIGWLNLDVVGWIFMLTGVAMVAMTSYFWRRRRAVVRTQTVQPVVQRTVVEERPTHTVPRTDDGGGY
ncbi:DUF6458 family protein [Longispora urticae]